MRLAAVQDNMGMRLVAVQDNMGMRLDEEILHLLASTVYQPSPSSPL